MGFRVFCSYAHKDEKLLEQLRSHLSSLRRQKIIEDWYDRNISPSNHWAEDIDAHWNNAHIVFLLVSPYFVDSDYCYSIEMVRALEREKAGEARVIPIIARPVDWQGLPFSYLQALPRDADPISLARNRDQAFAQVTSQIRSLIEKLPPADTFSHSTTSLWTVPFSRNPRFIDREDILQQLRATLTLRRIPTLISYHQSISSGIGKTQIAVEYAYRQREQYKGIFWIHGDKKENIENDFIGLARKLELPEQEFGFPEIVIPAVKRWFNEHPGWLLIFDNVENLVLIDSYLPEKTAGHILIVTNDYSDHKIPTVKVDVLDPENASLMLLDYAGRLKEEQLLSQPTSDKEAEKLAQIIEKLGRHPLALLTNGNAIKVKARTLDQLLTFYQDNDSSSESSESSTEKAISASLDLSFGTLTYMNPLAPTFLDICACLAPDNIPEELFIDGAYELGRRFVGDREEVVEKVNGVISDLQSYSLIQRDATTQTLTIHRAVQAEI